MSYLNVKINDPSVRVYEGVSAKGKAYTMRSQSVLITKDEEVKKCDIGLTEHQKPYPVGLYTLDPITLLEFGKFGLEYKKFVEIHLVPVSSNEKPSLFAKTA